MTKPEMTCPQCNAVISYQRKDGTISFRIKTLLVKGNEKMVKGVCKKCGHEVNLPLKTAIPIAVASPIQKGGEGNRSPGISTVPGRIRGRPVKR